MNFTLDVPRYGPRRRGLRSRRSAAPRATPSLRCALRPPHDLVLGEPTVRASRTAMRCRQGGRRSRCRSPAAADTPHGGLRGALPPRGVALVAEGHVTFKAARVAAADYPAFRELVAPGSTAPSRGRSASPRLPPRGLPPIRRLPAPPPPPRRSSSSRWRAGPRGAGPGRSASGGARATRSSSGRRRATRRRASRARSWRGGRGPLGAARRRAPRPPRPRRRGRGPAPPRRRRPPRHVPARARRAPPARRARGGVRRSRARDRGRPRAAVAAGASPGSPPTARASRGSRRPRCWATTSGSPRSAPRTAP